MKERPPGVRRLGFFLHMKMFDSFLFLVVCFLFLLPYVLYAHLGREKNPGWRGLVVLLLGGLPQVIFGVVVATHMGYMWALPAVVVALAGWPLVVSLCRRRALWTWLELGMWGGVGMGGLWLLVLLVVYAWQ